MIPMWLYVVAAAVIAAAAFAIGQVFPGLGVPFVVLATTFWTAYAAYWGSKLKRRGC